jgi:F1F0 ATPase subunit 2
MSDALPLIAAWVAGLALAILFFGGLWWTVPRGMASRHPALWFGTSLLLRSGTVLGGIYLVGRGDWTRMAACLTGFIMMKPLVLWATRRFTREAANAPHA